MRQNSTYSSTVRAPHHLGVTTLPNGFVNPERVKDPINAAPVMVSDGAIPNPPLLKCK